MHNYQITFDTWNKIAALYQEKFMDIDLYNDTYDRFCALLEKKNPCLFEVGCGPGNITRYVMNRRADFHIHAIDVSPEMIGFAKRNNPTVQFSVMDCRSIDTIPSTFDGIICGFCIPYLSKRDTEKLIFDFSNLLADGGLLYISAIQGDYETSGYVTTSTGHPTLLFYYDEAYLQHLLAQNNFTVLDLQHKQFPREYQPCPLEMIFIARKNSNRSS